MGGADDLRIAVAQEIADYLRDLGDGGISPGTLAARITERLDVTETTVMPDGSMYPFHPSGPEPQRILVVRPRGEAK